MIYVLIEESIDDAKAVFASAEKSLVEAEVKRLFSSDLRFLADGLWRCGSSIISIQEVELSS